jgi:hypothetical protein
MDDDTVWLLVVGVHVDLDFGVGIHADVKDPAILGKPGIGPPPIVTDANGGYTVDDVPGLAGACPLHLRRHCALV